MQLAIIEHELIQAKPYFTTISPGIPGTIKAVGKGRTIKMALKGVGILKGAYDVFTGKQEPSDVAAGQLSNAVLKKAAAPVTRRITRAHHIAQRNSFDPFRKNGMGGRTWIDKPGQYPMVIVFHDANKAGPHLDVHIGRFSVIRRVKPEVYDKLTYNHDGYLTNASKDRLLEFLREEIDNGSRIPQNLDHTITNAKMSWVDGDTDSDAYGSGATRQVIAEETVEVYKAHHHGPVEFYAPLLNKHRSMYFYRLYPGDDTRAPILIWGNKANDPPPLEDRLHLKMIDPRNMDKVAEKADLSTATAKYDGMSCYLHITSSGTHVYSPRISKVSGKRIEYTPKLDGVAHVTNDESILAMGELLFKRRSRWPWKADEYLSAAESGGIVNADKVLPADIEPEVRLYRIDRVGRSKTVNLDFWENRELQKQVAQLSDKLDVVELMDPETARRQGFEGIVAVPSDGSVNDGIKVKWWQDPHDWRIDAVEFEPGDKGGIAGVVRATSLESGKQFKLGPSQMGDRELQETMMVNPSDYEGRVIKVLSRHGHEGRASKVESFHTDKGVG